MFEIKMYIIEQGLFKLQTVSVDEYSLKFSKYCKYRTSPKTSKYLSFIFNMFFPAMIELLTFIWLIKLAYEFYRGIKREQCRIVHEKRCIWTRITWMYMNGKEYIFIILWFDFVVNKTSFLLYPRQPCKPKPQILPLTHKWEATKSEN